MRFEELNSVLGEILFPKSTLMDKLIYAIDRLLRKVGLWCDHSMEYTGTDCDRKCCKCDFIIIDPRPRHFNCRSVLIPIEDERKQECQET